MEHLVHQTFANQILNSNFLRVSEHIKSKWGANMTFNELNFYNSLITDLWYHIQPLTVIKNMRLIVLTRWVRIMNKFIMGCRTGERALHTSWLVNVWLETASSYRRCLPMYSGFGWGRAVTSPLRVCAERWLCHWQKKREVCQGELNQSTVYVAQMNSALNGLNTGHPTDKYEIFFCRYQVPMQASHPSYYLGPLPISCSQGCMYTNFCWPPNDLPLLSNLKSSSASTRHIHIPPHYPHCDIVSTRKFIGTTYLYSCMQAWQHIFSSLNTNNWKKAQNLNCKNRIAPINWTLGNWSWINSYHTFTFSRRNKSRGKVQFYPVFKYHCP